jgi:hypothetical protein
MSVRLAGFRRLIALAAALAIATTGCSSAIAYRPGQQPKAVHCDHYAQYNLYTAGDVVPLRCALIQQGDLIGFARADDGGLLAVAGKVLVPVPDAVYEWRVLGGSDRNVGLCQELVDGTLRVARMTLIVVLAPFALIGLSLGGGGSKEVKGLLSG